MPTVDIKEVDRRHRFEFRLMSIRPLISPASSAVNVSIQNPAPAESPRPSRRSVLRNAGLAAAL
ncbi:MAG: hypothetical protein ACO1SX_04030, partial [Actinomycetota bacterium]